MKQDILIVDDDKLILTFTADVLQKVGSHPIVTSSPLEALEIVSRQPIAVVVSDHFMPEMNGNELLTRIKELSPSTTRIMMTSATDLNIALTAINSGEVFRFLPKPWKVGEMVKAVKDGLRRYRMLEAVRNDDDFILRSLAETIELKDPYTKGHCERVADYALLIAEKLGLDDGIRRDIMRGSWLHDCGKIGVPEAVLNANRKLTSEEREIVNMHPVWGANVAEKANLPATVINIVLHHHEHYDGHGYPMGLAAGEIPLEARIVAVADIFDALKSDRPYRPGMSLAETVAMLTEMRGAELDPDLVDLFLPIIHKREGCS
jgi:putative nucleotidyltransferase with HDIG domain